MPRAKLPPGATHEAYLKYDLCRAEHEESNDCVIRALSVVTGVSYAEVRALINSLGRKPGYGVQIDITRDAIAKLGYTYQEIHLANFNPPARAARGKHGITSHHPDRFPEMWKDKGALLCWNRTHMWAVVNGVNIDWSRGKSLRVDCIGKLEKIP